MGISAEDRVKLRKEIDEVQEKLERLRLEIHGADAPDAPLTRRELELGEKLRQLLVKEKGLAEED